MSSLDYMTILVIDDDALVRNVLVEYLQRFGFKRILTAKDGRHALKMIQDKKLSIDLILSDWEMPDVDGLTILKATRNAPHRAQAKFIMVTSQGSQERMKISKAGRHKANAYIIKPFLGKTLRDKIWGVMGWELTDEAKKAG